MGGKARWLDLIDYEIDLTIEISIRSIPIIMQLFYERLVNSL